MKNPTRKQFNILCDVQDAGGVQKVNSDPKMSEHLELVSMGYLEKKPSKSIMHDCEFTLTEKAKEYLSEI